MSPDFHMGGTALVQYSGGGGVINKYKTNKWGNLGNYDKWKKTETDYTLFYILEKLQ